MGCGSSKPTQLTVPPTTPGPRMLKEDTPTGQVLTSPTPQATDRDSRIPENIQVTRSRVVVAVEAERVIQIETDNTPAESPCLTRTDIDGVSLPGEDIMGIEELPTTTETVYTTTDKDILNFDSIWNYNCGAISDQARILTTYLATEPLTIRFFHISPNNSTLIPFWVNNASKIEVIDLSDNYIGPEAFRTVLLALGYLPHLKSLNISSNNSDKFCSCLHFMSPTGHSIKSLDLVINLSNLQSLESGSTIAAVQDFIANSPLLEELDVSNNELSGGSFGRELANGLQVACNIVCLNVSGCGLVDIEPLFRMEPQCNFYTTIRRLDISHNPISSQLFCNTVDGFITKVQLEDLNLNGCSLSPPAISKLTKALFNNSSLLKLNTSANTFSDKSSLIQLVTVCLLQGIITELIISNIAYAEDKENKYFIDIIASLIQGKLEGTISNLKKLTLSSCKLDGPTLQLLRYNMLATKVQLTEIDFSSNIECVADNIRRFACGIKPGENILSELSTLTDGTNMGDNIIGLMRGGALPSLKKLSLIRSRITPNKVGNISEFISKIESSDVNETIGEIPELTELVLDGIKLAGTNRSAIVNLFNAITFLQNSNAKVNWSLTSLSLNSCSLNDSDIKPVSQALTRGLNLNQLSLAYNRLGDNAVIQLTEGLSFCKSLKSINLCNNRICSKGATVLADCLSRLDVERIQISGNLIGPDGVLALVNLARICPALRYIDIRDQKSEFSENYLQYYLANIVQVIESRFSSGSMKPPVVMKLSGVGECQSMDWLGIDSQNIETNTRKYKMTSIGLWEALTLLYCFSVARYPDVKRSRKKYPQSYQNMREGIGEVRVTSGEWKEVLGSSQFLPSWLFVEGHRERGVFISRLPVAVTQEKLDGVLEGHVDCRVVEVVMCKDSVRQENIGSAWVLFEDKQSVVNAVEYYNNGEASLYGQPYIITPLSVRIIDSDMKERGNLEVVRADITERAHQKSINTDEYKDWVQHNYQESQARHGKLLENPAYQGGRIW